MISAGARERRRCRSGGVGWRCGGGALLLLVMMVAQPEAVISATRQGLKLCAGSIVPALFPALVASELLVSSGVGERLGGGLSRPLRALFGISGCGAVVVLMGLLCGYPVAARTAAAYARQGSISGEELEHLLCFANLPGAAFVIGAVGTTLCHDVIAGRLLYLSVVLSAAAVGVIYRLLWRRGAGSDRAALPTVGGGTPSLADAIGQATGTMLSVVATVVFFGAVSGMLRAGVLRAGQFLGIERGAAVLCCLLHCLLEMTGGMGAAAALTQQLAGAATLVLPICAATLGWGGLSVQMQLLLATGEYRRALHRGRLAGMRALQAALCVVILLALQWIRRRAEGGTI